MRGSVSILLLLFSTFGAAASQTHHHQEPGGDLPRFGQRPEGSAFEACFDTITAIPAIGEVTTTLHIPCPQETVVDLELVVKITHTWVGDLSATLAKQGSGSAVVFDRPGMPGQGTFGCAGDDVDATIDDEARSPIEDECEPTIPTIFGEFIGGDPPDDTLMSTWEGEEICGTWTLTVEDAAGADQGFIEQWCLTNGPDDGSENGGDVPATTDIGAVLTALLVCVSGGWLCRGSTGCSR